MAASSPMIDADAPPREVLSIGLVVRGDPTHRTGSTERILQTYSALKAHGEVVMYCMTIRRPDIATDSTGDDPIVWIPMERRRVLPHDYLASLVGWRPRRLMAARPRRQRRIVGAIIRPHDIVWTYTDRAFLALPPHVRRTSRVIADLIDLEDQRDIELARRAERWRGVRTSLARLDARSLRRTLRVIARQSDRTVISSEVDRQRLGVADVFVLPNTYTLVGEPVGRVEFEGPPIFLFVGFLAYGPNVDAVHWLVDSIWPTVRDECPDAELRIVGRGLADGSFAGIDGVTVVGPVDSIETELRTASATLAPLRIGSGTRIKILEGWAQRVPVIATSVGAEGLAYENERELVIADSSDAFAAAMVRVAREATLREHLVYNGSELWRRRYSPEASELRVAELVRSVTETR